MAFLPGLGILYWKLMCRVGHTLFLYQYHVQTGQVFSERKRGIRAIIVAAAEENSTTWASQGGHVLYHCRFCTFLHGYPHTL